MRRGRSGRGRRDDPPQHRSGNDRVDRQPKPPSQCFKPLREQQDSSDWDEESPTRTKVKSVVRVVGQPVTTDPYTVFTPPVVPPLPSTQAAPTATVTSASDAVTSATSETMDIPITGQTVDDLSYPDYEGSYEDDEWEVHTVLPPTDPGLDQSAEDVVVEGEYVLEEEASATATDFDDQVTVSLPVRTVGELQIEVDPLEEEEFLQNEL